MYQWLFPIKTYEINSYSDALSLALSDNSLDVLVSGRA